MHFQNDIFDSLSCFGLGIVVLTIFLINMCPACVESEHSVKNVKQHFTNVCAFSMKHITYKCISY